MWFTLQPNSDLIRHSYCSRATAEMTRVHIFFPPYMKLFSIACSLVVLVEAFHSFLSSPGPTHFFFFAVISSLEILPYDLYV